MPAELYVCDLDGTLLGPDARLSEFARAGLRDLLAAGVQLTASSRRTASMRVLLAGVGLRLPVIELNGAFVSELQSGRHLVGNTLTAPLASEALNAFSATGSDPVVTSATETANPVYFGSRQNAATRWYLDEKRAYGDSDLERCDDLPALAERVPIAAITGFVADPEAAAFTSQLKELLGGGAIVYSAANYYCPGWTEVQVQHPLAEKGAAVRELLAVAGIDDAEVVGSNAEDGIVRHLLALHGVPEPKAPTGADASRSTRQG